MEETRLVEETLSTTSRRAWDSLYRQTEALVWGDRPIGFLEEFAALLAPQGNGGARLMDAAAGEGRNLGGLMELSAEVWACDSSPHALGKIAPRLRGSVARSVCDLARLPFADECFDGVLATDIIETLPDPEPALREIHRVLRPGGRLLCNIPGFEDEIAGVDMLPLGENRFLFRGAFFYRFLAEHESQALLTRNGFAILRNEICRWVEEPHPEFRSRRHAHTSRVFLVEKATVAEAR
jgi:SAM-dependent methyltransferase